MQPIAELAEGSPGFYLYSFAPASGVGFYLRDDAVYKFDLLTKEQSQLEDAALVAVRAEFDQLKANAHFESYEDLLSFTTTEYLRDKKNTLYALLFTQDLGEQLNIKTLQLLDEAGFSEVQFSEKAVPILSDIADRRRVYDIVQLAHELGLKNVQYCLGNELQDLTFDVMRQVIDYAQRWNLAKELPSLFARTLSLLATYVSVVKEIPQFAHMALEMAFHYAEQNIELLTRTGLSDLSKLSARFERTSPVLDYAKAISEGKAGLLSETFTSALLHTEPDTFKHLSSRLAELSPFADEKLETLGQQLLELSIIWEIRYYRSPYLLEPVLMVPQPFEQWEYVAELVMFGMREVQTRYRNQTIFNRTASNIQFAIDFLFLDKFSGESRVTWHTATKSFWFAFYADPGRALDRLHGFSLELSYRSLEDILDYNTKRLERDPISYRSLLSGYSLSNFLSLYFMDSKKFDAPETKEFVSRLFDLLTHNQSWKKVSRYIQPTHPFEILLSNMLAWALQTRQDEFADRMIGYIRNAPSERLTLSPFIRIVL